MPKYVIEREIPGVGGSTADALQAVSQTSCNVLNELGTQIQWVHSYVTGDKIDCVYISPNEEMIREHAKRGGDVSFDLSLHSELLRFGQTSSAGVWRLRLRRPRCGRS